MVSGTRWQAWVADEGERFVFLSGAWAPSFAELEEVAKLGGNVAANDTRRLSVQSDQSLFTHDGDDHRMVINRNASTDVASLIFQQDYSGRGEVSLGADSAFTLRTSVDGAAWQSRASRRRLARSR
ncbi:MAG: hypothetical protein IE925_02265 [Rhodobacterales bacterium]|nr:hypothetical protein [Rhodobacterales bacterium]